MNRYLYFLIALLLTVTSGDCATKPPDVSKVRFEITHISKKAGMLHWKITNHSEDGVFIYNFFLLGPAFNIERKPGKLIFDTTPIVRVASCFPNRLAPLLLLFIRSGGMIEGDFVDPEVKKVGGNGFRSRSRSDQSQIQLWKRKSAFSIASAVSIVPTTL